MENEKLGNKEKSGEDHIHSLISKKYSKDINENHDIACPLAIE